MNYKTNAKAFLIPGQIYTAYVKQNSSVLKLQTH